MSAPSKVARCAIYTRKSSEEGLEQGFNSLHAQREACEAYIKSQRHEGWTPSPAIYDDGGYSGGALERPAMQRLLADIAAKKIQVVVVYKVDRLTRSLADFARLVETFDVHGASFVSVTQQFNTTSSMGRLTLNVLLSFAQFEREVTGERIRDKIAASKKKGLWMGGGVPLGYEPKDRTLMIVPEDAKMVRHLFDRYLALKSVDALVRELETQGIRTKQRISKRGTRMGGARFYRGALLHMLKNPVYLGEIRHKTLVYPGQHPAIVDRETWDKAQEYLRTGARRLQGKPPIGSHAPLAGKIFDTAGNRMTPTHSQKKDGRRYRFYVSVAALKQRPLDGIEIARISAGIIEPLVTKAIAGGGKALDLSAISRVVVGSTEIKIEANDASELIDGQIMISVPIRLTRRGQGIHVSYPDGIAGSRPNYPDQVLVRALARAHRWRAMLESGDARSIAGLARSEHRGETYISRLLRLTYIAPDLIDAILNGTQAACFTVQKLRNVVVPLDWDGQRALLGRV